MINVLSLISFANAVFFIFLSIYSLACGPKARINRASALECALLAIWSFSYTFFYVAPTKESAWFWLKLGSIGWSSFMCVLVWFFLVLTRQKKNIYTEIKMAILTGITILLLVFNLFLPQMSPAIDLMQSTTGLGWTYVNQLDNKLYWFYVAYIVFGCYLCIEILIDWLKRSTSKHFRRLAMVFLGVDSLLIIIGFLSDLVIPLITHAIPPMTNFFLVIFCFSYWIIIFKFDVFKKTLLESSEYILDTISDALFVLDYQGIILHCNKAAEELLQYSMKEMVGKNLVYFYKNSHYNESRIKQLVLEKKLVDMEEDLITKSGTLIHGMYSASIAEDDIHGFMGIIISFHDITKQKKLEHKLFELAHFDELTNLPNRRYLMDTLYIKEKNYEMEHKDFAILFMDLNGFKEINDTMGHEIGDQLLKEVGKRISSCMNETDMVARIGGDEFVMLQANVESVEQVEARKEKIDEEIRQNMVFQEKQCSVGISIGFSLFSEMKSVKKMMQEADYHMYEQKREL